jgi:anhydro-N-acetylmuramic acid kinase
MDKYVIGLMSGTSLDGLDIVYVKFNLNNLKNYKIINAQTTDYSNECRNHLKNAFHYTADELMKLDAGYGQFLAEQINMFIKKNKIDKIDLIASHGQTIFHRPELGYTTQIGSGAQINTITKIKTICDFRTQDVALGGQGAPLVPIGDQLLFSEYDYCLNIGGFANISYQNNNKRYAYDICPANIVLNHYINQIGKEYDEGGKLAKTGKIKPDLLNELNSLSFYNENHAKSLGWEFVVDTIVPIIDKYSLQIEDVLHTFVEHIAVQISNKTNSGKMLITGGGAYHQYMIERIEKIGNTQVVIPDNITIDFKEALIFALLGLLKDANKINILSSVTGSKFDHSSGIIYNMYNQ